MGNLINPGEIDLGVLTKAYNQEWLFFEGDFEQIENCASFHSESSWVYADPPYFGTHSAYTAKPFTWNDQKRLAHWLASQNCPVVASNSNHLAVLSLYESLGFTIELIPVKRSINCKGDGRQAAVEMLAYKNIGEVENAEV